MKCIILLYIVSLLIVLGNTQSELGGTFETARQVCQTDLLSKIIEDMKRRPGSQHNYQMSKELVNDQLLCMYVNSGIMSREGVINSAVLEQRLREVIRDQDVLNNILRDCSASRRHGSPPETAAVLYGCITRNLK